jgi:hypothetical protein
MMSQKVTETRLKSISFYLCQGQWSCDKEVNHRVTFNESDLKYHAMARTQTRHLS